MSDRQFNDEWFWNCDEERHIVGYLCAFYPDGPMIPPASYDKPCAKGDRAVWSDGTMTDV